MTKKDGKPCKKCGLFDWGQNGQCKECARRYAREKYHENPERARRLRREWTANNLEHSRKIKREWKRRNKESHVQSSMKWIRENREKQREYIRKWNNSHPIKRRVAKQNRRARKKQLKSEPYNFKEICNYYGNRCLCCGRDDLLLTIDHVIPISWGGPDVASNIQPLCGPCNTAKNAYRATDYRKNRFEYWKQLSIFDKKGH